MTEALLFFGGLTAGILLGASSMALAYFHVMAVKAKEEPVEVVQNGGLAPRELNRCSKKNNVILIDRGRRDAC